MRALFALLTAAFLISGCARKEPEEVAPPPADTTTPSTMPTEPSPTPPPSETPPGDTPPSDTTPPPAEPSPTP